MHVCECGADACALLTSRHEISARFQNSAITDTMRKPHWWLATCLAVCLQIAGPHLRVGARCTRRTEVGV